jgi:hypothetical protein
LAVCFTLQVARILWMDIGVVNPPVKIYSNQ